MKHITFTLALLVMAFLAFPVMAADSTGKVNINSAGIEELRLLPRVGPSIAKRIVEFRDQHGTFQNVEDLMLVRGIGQKTFELLKPYVAVSGDTTLTEPIRVSRKKKA